MEDVNRDRPSKQSKLRAPRETREYLRNSSSDPAPGNGTAGIAAQCQVIVVSLAFRLSHTQFTDGSTEVRGCWTLETSDHMSLRGLASEGSKGARSRPQKELFEADLGLFGHCSVPRVHESVLFHCLADTAVPGIGLWRQCSPGRNLSRKPRNWLDSQNQVD